MMGFSYGFRPERHQHKALDAVWVGITRRKVGWVLDADIHGFFDAIDHKWLAKFGLELHPEKTRLLEFGRFAETNRTERGEGKPETFDFLGFTHICAKTWKNNAFTIRRKTIAKRLRAKVKEIRKEIMRRRHQTIPDQGKWLRSVVHGHLNYFAVPGNRQSTDAFRTEIAKAWLRALRRRSQKGAKLTWERVKRLIKTWLPTAKVKHPYPNQRLCVT